MGIPFVAYGTQNVTSLLLASFSSHGHTPEHSAAEKQQVIPGDMMLSTVERQITQFEDQPGPCLPVTTDRRRLLPKAT